MKDVLVATFAASQTGTVTPSFLTVIASRLRDYAATPLEQAWLEDGKVADIFFSGMDVIAAYETFRTLIADRPIDVIVQPVATRRKKLLFADLESTIIEQEMLDELADLLGQRDKVADITRRAMNGELDFVTALKQRVALLEGQSASLLEKAAQRITIMPGAAELVYALRSLQGSCWLVSGGFRFFAGMIGSALAFEEAFANHLIVDDGILTGKVAEPILDKETKRRILEEGIKKKNIDPSEAMAVGDGANDIPMLVCCNEKGGLGVAYKAKTSVQVVVPHQINHTDLRTLVYAQGIKISQAGAKQKSVV